MTSLTMYVDGESVRLGKRIGRGGEGEVFALENDLERVLKIYTSTADVQQREAKINSIVNRRIGQNSSLVAFPLAVARRNDGKFAGFVMKRVDGHKPLFELYSPGARKKNFPRADFRFLVRTAANVCRAVASVHKTGCVIGDINHSGILVSDEAKVALIDADSFQIIDGADKFLCRVGVPEYTPPELQGKKLSNVMRTANHDAFGLSVVVFQLLFMGRHPFVGAFAKGDMPMEKAIFENRFVYSSRRDVGMTRPPGAASLADFPSYIADAFEQAFSPNAESRPTAEAWISLLVRLESAIVQCASDNLHYYPQVAAECPWCRMENKLGILLFLPNFLSRGAATFDPGAASFDLSAAWAAIEKVVLPSASLLQPVVPAIDYVPSQEAKKAKGNIWKSKSVGIIALLFTGIVAFRWPSAWYLWSIGIIFAYVKFFRIRVESQQDFIDAYQKNMLRFKEATEAWRTRSGITQALEVKNALLESKRQLNKLEREKALRLSVYQNKRRGLQMLNFLESQEIRKAKIRHVGLARQTALASYGIETALDIVEEKVLQVPGFGANNSVPLFEWRRNVEKSFVYDPKPNEMDKAELQRVQFEIDKTGSEHRRILLSGPSDLTRAVHAISAREKKVDPQIARAFKEMSRAKEDLLYLGIPIPKRTTPAEAKSNPNPPAKSRSGAGAAANSRGGAAARLANRRSSPGGQGSTSRNASQHAAKAHCPKCGQPSLKRVVRHGSHAGKTFYGCSTYPVCNGII
jgi:DNA-binding helix-hairpin-helix protein with protein kinase domain